MTNAQSPLWSASIFHSLDLQFSQRFIYEWMEQTFPNPIKKKKNLRDCTIKAGHSVPMVSSRMFAALSLLKNTEHSLVCRRFSGMTLGTSVAWRKKGGGGRGGWTEDTDHSHTNTALCPSTADGEGQICSLLPGKPVDVIKSWREEHRKADGSLLPGLYFYCHTLFEVQCLRATCLICPKNIIYVLLFFYKFQVQNLKCQQM